ncbi:hypothetical protein PC9H_010955 [Pleurotus ostreatus]|uniref:Alpha/beta-hydrolase n=1 Tax=Pleurotus ostreatus TaxID=5322 RepID=A0A8H6ZNR6_PLEOS|nr:uncharacterized protein PC9H_010955 [Pleurotus ostreatus]KAF7422796.1 hypothetical protein PC9H_010955 [Pleurotus ostreatus]KAJ8691267.1 hypothetical protein PTI98_010856 [Pleurotus ostreatus]
MHSVYVPAHVTLFLRRLVNVFGTLSLSNQYLLHRQAKLDNLQAHGSGMEVNSEPLQHSRWPVLKRMLEWPRWKDLSGNGTLESSVLGLPWLTERKWTWNSLMQLSRNDRESAEHHEPPHEPPRNPHNAPRHHRRTPRPKDDTPPDIIHQLLANPALSDPIRTPRYPVVLCHGLYGFDVRGPSSFPSLRVHYWSNVLNILRDKVGADVIVTSVPGTGSINSRAETLHKQLEVRARGRGVNLLAHSMGGLDCRHLITHIKPTEYTPLSLTSVSTPHRGSPFMDWCAEYIGIGKLRKAEQEAFAASAPSTSPPPPNPVSSIPFSLSLSSLPSSFTTLLLSVVDSPAYANLTTAYLNTVFNPSTPNDPKVKYFSVASRLEGVSVWHPFWLPKMVCDGWEEKERGRLRTVWEGLESHESTEDDMKRWAWEREWGNDGLVTIQSAKWGEFLGILEGCDHWEMRGARGLELDITAIAGAADGWSIKDWGRFIGAWKKEEKLQRDDAARTASNVDPAPPTPSRSSISIEPDRSSETKASLREQARTRQREQDDDVIKSSTKNLSAVFDWLVDQVPTPPILGGKAKAKEQIEADLHDSSHARGRTAEGRKKKNELEKKEDLERFYVALSRKLYDEGL